MNASTTAPLFRNCVIGSKHHSPGGSCEKGHGDAFGDAFEATLFYSVILIPQYRWHPLHPLCYPLGMSRARKDILYDNCLAHITFKCHNSEFYFHSDLMKEEIIKIVARNKKRYRIPIYDFVFMSNHPHPILTTL